MKILFTILRLRSILMLLLFFAIFLACNKPDSENPETEYESCGVENLITDLPWLKNIINNNSVYTIHEYAFIYSYDFNNRQVIYLWNSASSQNPRIVFKCDGTELLSSTSTKEAWEEFESKRTEEALLWQKTPDPLAILCGVKNPITDLLWLKKRVEDNPYRMYKGARIWSYVFEEKEVFFIWNPASSYSPGDGGVYDCNGTALLTFQYPTTTQDWERFENERTKEVLLWMKE